MPSNHCPFIAGPTIHAPEAFIGRKHELQILVNSMTGVQPISINLFGARQMGKSSLLYNFFLTWSNWAIDPARYGVAYLDLKLTPCTTTSQFYQTVASVLQKAMALPLLNDVTDFTTFKANLEHWQQQKKLPVLCLNEFEQLTNLTQTFQDDFFDNLRSLLNSSLLMMIITTKSSFLELKTKLNSSSAFFNLAQHIPLQAFIPEDVSALLQQPHMNNPKGPPCLTSQEQHLAQQWGGHFPYPLQVAALSLYQFKDIALAKNNFDTQINTNSTLGRWWSWTHLPLQSAMLTSINTLGQFIWKIGQMSAKIATTITGLLFLLALVLLITGQISLEEIWRLLKIK